MNEIFSINNKNQLVVWKLFNDTFWLWNNWVFHQTDGVLWQQLVSGKLLKDGSFTIKAYIKQDAVL